MIIDQSRLFIEDEYEELNIDSIEKEEGNFDLIDINVDEDQTFCVTPLNIISHNCRSMLRVLTYKAAKAGIPIIFTNHIYASMELYPSLIKTQSGGQGPVYLASLIVQLGVRSEKQDDKNEDDVMIPIANKISGVTLRAMTVKNRFIPPFLETELYLNFKTGLYKYSGLVEMASAYGIIIQNGPSWKLANGEILGYQKDWKNNDDLWNTKILPLLEEKINKEFLYSKEPPKV